MSHRNWNLLRESCIRSPRSEQRPGKPYRPIPPTDAGRRPRPAGPLVGEKVLAGTPREEVPLSVFGRVPHY